MTLLWASLLVALLLVPLVLGLYLWARGRRRPQAARYSSLSLFARGRPAAATLAAPRADRAAARRHRDDARSRSPGRSRCSRVPSNQTTILLAMDVSGSMCADDIEPTRLRAAQDAASAFVRDLPAGTQIGLVGFSAFAADPPAAHRRPRRAAGHDREPARRAAARRSAAAS